MFLQRDAVTWVGYEEPAPGHGHSPIEDDADHHADATHGHAWRVRFLGADPSVKLQPELPSNYALNYFHGADRSRWASDVHAFSQVIYRQLWPGIDLCWSSRGLQVEYDLILQPGADASGIALEYQGIDGIVLDGNGDLVITTSLGVSRELKPTAWYADDHQPLACAFKLTGNTVGFTFEADFDRSRPIVIDPVLEGATYSGTNANKTYGYCGAYDNAGNIYGSGTSFLYGFPTTLGAFQEEHSTGFWDIVINKFNADASELIWSTYLGGAGTQSPLSIVANDAGDVFLLGTCYGYGYPTTTGSLFLDSIGNTDMVVSHLNASGSALLGSTYLGGTLHDGFSPDGASLAHWSTRNKGKIELDGMGNIWLISTTESPDYPTTPGAFQETSSGGFDAVVSCLSPDCSSLLRSTYIGGLRIEQGCDLRLAANGDIYICGFTDSEDFPFTQGAYQDACQCVDSLYFNKLYDGFIARLSNDLSTVLQATGYGTSERDWVYFMDLDQNGNVFISGLTDGTMAIDPPAVFGQEGNVFIAAFDPTLTTRLLSTTFGHGGPSWEYSFIPAAFGIDSCDRINISGFEAHGGLIHTSDAFDDNWTDDKKIYMAAFPHDMGGILFGSYYGGSHIDGGHSRFNDAGVLFQGICSHNTEMPATLGAYSAGEGVSYDLGLLKVDLYEALCDQNVGISMSHALHDDLTVAPVPASSSIMIEGIPGGSMPVVIDVLDALGRSVERGVLPVDGRLNIGSLSSGSYVVRVFASNGTPYTARFIKE